MYQYELNYWEMVHAKTWFEKIEWIENFGMEEGV